MRKASPHSATARSRILDLDAARRAVRTARRRGETIVFTNGCFDLLHVGHVRSLEQARRHGDRLIVAINSDASARRLKGPQRPIVPARQRAELLGALQCVDWVVVFRSDTPLSTIRALRPDVLAKGSDWKKSEIVGAKDVEGWGGRVVSLKQVAGLRTSHVVKRIRVNR